MAQIKGIVIGTRKAGTTWLYENFKLDPEVSVSNLVKESNYFCEDRLTEQEYHGYFDSRENCIEVDSSLCYSTYAPVKISEYDPQVKLLLILRNPIDFAVSRYIHSERKGELQLHESISECIQADPIFKLELDYLSIVRSFQDKFNDRLAIIPFDLLKTNPVHFYQFSKLHLVGSRTLDFELLGGINKSRSSKFEKFSIILSNMAKFFRNIGLHSIVNLAKKKFPFHLIETELKEDSKNLMREQIKNDIENYYPESIVIYEEILGQTKDLLVPKK